MPKLTMDEAELLKLMRADQAVHLARQARSNLRDQADECAGPPKPCQAERHRKRRQAAKDAGALVGTASAGAEITLFAAEKRLNAD
jgi:hypothetical protein